MVSFKQLVLGSVALIGFAANANAAFATWQDEITQYQYVGSGSSYTYTHDIAQWGFAPLQDRVDSFSLAIDLWDDQDRAAEKFQVDITGLNAGSSYSFGNDAFHSGTTILGWIELNLLGTLTVTVNSVCNWTVCGDFFVGNSSLVAKGDSTQVPEPTTIALLGLGLLGVGFGRRKKLNH